MSTNKKEDSSTQTEPQPKVALPAQIEILSLLVQEFEDWLAEHGKDASRRRELTRRLEATVNLRNLKLLVDEDDPRTKEFREQYFAAIARGKKALESMPQPVYSAHWDYMRSRDKKMLKNE